MGLYQRFILPHIVHAACGVKPAMRQRELIVPQAKGTVLEVGFGSGLNLPYYNEDKVKHLYALEPSAGMRAIAGRNIADSSLQPEIVDAAAECMPLESNSVDSVVVTYSLCTIADPQQAMAEIRRVLKPAGDLLFCEHGAAPDADIALWQRRMNPLWKAFGGGCNLNREIPHLILAGGFRFKDIKTLYLPGWRPATFNFFGRARPR